MYFAEPFDDWHAWTDLLLMADSEGKLTISLNALKIRWKWKSYKEVRAYMGKLKGKGMVTLKGKPTGTEICISKYWAYQASADAKNKSKGQTKGQAIGQTKGQVRSTLQEGDVKSPPSGEVLLKERDREIANFFESVKDEDFDD